MIASAHVLAGVVCGLAALSARTHAARFMVALGGGVLSHVILDAVPHSDYRTLSTNQALVVAAFEVAATIALAWYVLRSRPPAHWRVALPAGVFGATVPDAKASAAFLPEWPGAWLLKVGEGFHQPFHASPSPLTVGLIAELVCIAILLAGLLMMARRLPEQRTAVRRTEGSKPAPPAG